MPPLPAESPKAGVKGVVYEKFFDSDHNNGCFGVIGSLVDEEGSEAKGTKKQVSASNENAAVLALFGNFHDGFFISHLYMGLA